MEYPALLEQLDSLCLAEIRKHAAEADNRLKYKKVCSSIKQLLAYSD
jgi:hypothetical protein